MAQTNGQKVEGKNKVGDSSTGEGGFPLMVKDGSGNLQFGELGDNNGIKVDIVDATGITVDVDVQQYAVGAIAGATDLGNLSLAVRDDALSTLTDAEGDYVQTRVDAEGALWVKHSGSLAVTATDLDIRDLTSVSDSVEVLQATASNLNATVVATNLDIRDLTSASDSVEVLQATASNLNATVVATDLDIRNLSASQDNVAISDGTDTLAVNADGSINVAQTTLGRAHSYATVAIAEAGNANVVTWSPAGSAKKAYRITCSANADLRWEVLYGTTASEVTKMMFWTSPASPCAQKELVVELETTETLIVKAYNEDDDGSINAYATIEHDE